MSVSVMLMGRLGNNLFQYALGRIIAERLGFALSCRRYPGAAAGGFIGLDQDTPGANLLAASGAFADAPLRITGASHEAPIQTFQLGLDGWNGQEIDLAATLADRRPRRIVLAGYFQRHTYYAPWRDRIRRWFTLAPPASAPQVGARDVLINVRGGADFDALGWRISDRYYLDALASLPDVGRIHVVGVGIGESLRAALAPYAPVYYQAPPLDQMAVMTRFRRMILPNSTFSWWAAFLSDAELVIAPKIDAPEVFSFHGGGVDLRLEPSRYRELACEPARNPAPPGGDA